MSNDDKTGNGKFVSEELQKGLNLLDELMIEAGRRGDTFELRELKELKEKTKKQFRF